MSLSIYQIKMANQIYSPCSEVKEMKEPQPPVEASGKIDPRGHLANFRSE
jgi:hypothetical protein